MRRSRGWVQQSDSGSHLFFCFSLTDDVKEWWLDAKCHRYSAMNNNPEESLFYFDSDCVIWHKRTLVDITTIFIIIYFPPFTITLSYGLRPGHSTSGPCGTQCLLVLFLPSYWSIHVSGCVYHKAWSLSQLANLDKHSYMAVDVVDYPLLRPFQIQHPLAFWTRKYGVVWGHFWNIILLTLWSCFVTTQWFPCSKPAADIKTRMKTCRQCWP